MSFLGGLFENQLLKTERIILVFPRTKTRRVRKNNSRGAQEPYPKKYGVPMVLDMKDIKEKNKQKTLF